ncbi:NADH-quinone oxidoreductase subunit F [bacterium HR12]|nr:NADH-quinone oxidoreductase subunit F [bacterium HR12]
MSGTPRIVTAHWGDDGVVPYEGYVRAGGYEGLRRALSMSPEEVIAEVKASGLRGRGGAGFPTGLKWSFVPQDTGKPTYVVCNFDESEPGTFKDRELVEREPHQVLEGIAIAAYAVRSHLAFIYCRGEFLWPGSVLRRALEEAYAHGVLGERVLGSDYRLDVVLHRGAGAYICGEETALLSSLEGYRGQPRQRPPFPATEGLYASPTVINNVETLCFVPHILRNGASWFTGIGPERSPGTKVFSVSGKVERPGNYELPMGTPFRVLLEEHAGGVLGGRALKAWTPGGSSTPMLTAEHLDVALDFESLQQAGSMLGTGAVMVMDETDCIVEAVRRMLRFYAHESCGKCTPCREGTWWVSRVLDRIEAGLGRPEDLALLEDLPGNLLFRGFCPLLDGAVSPLASGLRYFREEFERHVEERRCPFTGRGPSTVAPEPPAPAPPEPAPGPVPLSEVLR